VVGRNKSGEVPGVWLEWYQGRVYQDSVSVIDQATGTITSTQTTENYYDSRGDLKASESPNGLWTIYTYDGAGGLTLEEIGTILATPNLISAIADDSHMVVLSASQYIYDGDGNVTATVQSLRDAGASSATGPLGTTNTPARVSLTAAF
jgi:hypothetical protein